MLKNITLSADMSLIARARDKAKSEKKSLNTVFREWLTHYTNKRTAAYGYRALMAELQEVNSGRHYSRDELNER
ncbi:MAG: hypothetical protein KAT71_05400 [Gammaproteobacteria bacterium]|nr:hypothetical protein [Gammaproteobacteria bacterium]